jgi:hypothetical protein
MLFKQMCICSKHLDPPVFNGFFFLFLSSKLATLTSAMLENLCLNKRKNKPAEFFENLNALSILLELLRKGNAHLFTNRKLLITINKHPASWH